MTRRVKENKAPKFTYIQYEIVAIVLIVQIEVQIQVMHLDHKFETGRYVYL